MLINNAVNGLVFVKSINIDVFPSGRRRAAMPDSGTATTTGSRYIPFDPEARLNTEANNRKHSGLNGFKQSFFKSYETSSIGGTISIVIDGYLFNIKLTTALKTIESFGNEILYQLGGSTEEKEIFANIKLANVSFFEGADGIPPVSTEVLRDQTLNDDPPSQCLDLLIPGVSAADATQASNYYFSGLSFSTSKREAPDNKYKSLLLFIKDETTGVWQIAETARLPKIDHGSTADSVNIPGDLLISNKSNSEPGNLAVEGNAKVAGNAEVAGTINVTGAAVFASDLEAAGVLTNKGHTVALIDLAPESGTNFENEAVTYYKLKFTGVRHE